MGPSHCDPPPAAPSCSRSGQVEHSFHAETLWSATKGLPELSVIPSFLASVSFFLRHLLHA